MSIFDRFKSKAEQLVGDAKEKMGDLTGAEGLADSGKMDQLAGEVQEVGQEVTDKAGDAKDKLTG